jgi:hypothetical protein
MADAHECRRQAAECTRLAETDIAPQSEVIMRSMARSWTALANQMDRLDERDPVNAAHLALARIGALGAATARVGQKINRH